MIIFHLYLNPKKMSSPGSFYLSKADGVYVLCKGLGGLSLLIKSNQMHWNLIWFLFLTYRGCFSVHKPCRRLAEPGWDVHSLKPQGILLTTLKRWASNYWIMHSRIPLTSVQPIFKKKPIQTIKIDNMFNFQDIKNQAHSQ